MEKQEIIAFADELNEFYSAYPLAKAGEDAFCFWFEHQIIRLFHAQNIPYESALLSKAVKQFVHDKFFVFKNSFPKKIKFRKMFIAFVLDNTQEKQSWMK